jgi:hypothetical protein
MKVLFLPIVENYLFDLVEILYKKGYFSFYENAEKYVSDIIIDIQTNINIRVKHKAPLRFKKYGTNLYYVTYKSNKRTTWYIFFSVHGNDKDTYLIRYITNNHVSAHHIRGL